jgi:D-alanyl-D-alanine carboxypeptidase
MTSRTLKTGKRRWHAKLKGVAYVIFAVTFWHTACAEEMPGAKEIDAYFRPYVATNNFSGSVVITHGGKVLFARSYGFADRSKRIPNKADTRFHIASISILFTSTAVLRLIDQGKLSFDAYVSDIVPGVPNGDKITIRELLEQNSGLPDANDDLPNYDELLKSHQTPESLIDQIKGLPLHSEPGGKSTREEHSGQNLLALIIERKTGLTFAQAMKAEVFDPFGMRDSGVDDDGPIAGPVAQGYQVAGTFGLKPAPAIHWSAKAGNGSAYATASDVSKWLQGLMRDNLLLESSRNAMLGISEGYGWEKLQSTRLGETVHLSGGRSPGFSCFMEYLPDEDLTIIALTNIENAANPLIIPEVAALLRGKPYQAFRYHRVPLALVGHPSGDFVFGPDFYRPSATLNLVSDAKGVTLNWPGGPVAPLLPIGRDKFKDRFYWIDATVIRGKDGNPVELNYGKFRGMLQAVPTPTNNPDKGN